MNDKRSFDQLVDDMAGLILTRLIAGEFRGGVALALNQAFHWYEEKRKENQKS